MDNNNINQEGITLKEETLQKSDKRKRVAFIVKEQKTLEVEKEENDKRMGLTKMKKWRKRKDKKTDRQKISWIGKEDRK